MNALDRSLAAHFRWLHTEGCTCKHLHKSYGRLYGIDMGKGWVRMTTDPDCPHHGEPPSARRGAEGAPITEKEQVDG